ncbi:hypothetical protein PO124_03090 [Bacillus licheniformis]|nr:hypothetical protein [Bacillus licheniformis]
MKRAPSKAAFQKHWSIGSFVCCFFRLDLPRACSKAHHGSPWGNQHAFGFTGGRFHPETLLRLIGLAEVMVGVLWLYPVRKGSGFFCISSCLCCFLPPREWLISHLCRTFNPVVLNAALIILSVIGYVSACGIPNAGNTIRKRR